MQLSMGTDRGTFTPLTRICLGELFDSTFEVVPKFKFFWSRRLRWSFPGDFAEIRPLLFAFIFIYEVGDSSVDFYILKSTD